MYLYSDTSYDLTFTNMDYSSDRAAFESGEGDRVAVNPTYAAYLAADGYVQAADFTQISDQDIIDAVYCQNELIEELSGDVELFLYCYYRACADMLANQDNRVAVAYEWYTNEGLDYSEQDVIDECCLKGDFTLDTVDTEEHQLGLLLAYARAYDVQL